MVRVQNFFGDLGIIWAHDRFVYDGTTGGCQKVMKAVDFTVDLEIPKDILSIASKNKYTAKQRQYK